MKNLIANDGETLKEEKVEIDGIPVLIRKKPDDPITNRVSIGGDLKTGFYCVYRGDKKFIEAMLRKCVKALDEDHVHCFCKNSGDYRYCCECGEEQ